MTMMMMIMMMLMVMVIMMMMMVMMMMMKVRMLASRLQAPDTRSRGRALDTEKVMAIFPVNSGQAEQQGEAVFLVMPATEAEA